MPEEIVIDVGEDVIPVRVRLSRPAGFQLHRSAAEPRPDLRVQVADRRGRVVELLREGVSIRCSGIDSAADTPADVVGPLAGPFSRTAVTAPRKWASHSCQGIASDTPQTSGSLPGWSGAPARVGAVPPAGRSGSARRRLRDR